jgi:uncharacterized membrane protein YeaQ/YmgE (transglycosylase-associated protein family)
MEIVLGILFGLVAGLLARPIMPGPRAGGVFVAAAVGVAGALLGILVARFGDGVRSTGFDIRGLMTAVAGTLILLFSYRSLALGVTSEHAP